MVEIRYLLIVTNLFGKVIEKSEWLSRKNAVDFAKMHFYPWHKVSIKCVHYWRATDFMNGY